MYIPLIDYWGKRKWWNEALTSCKWRTAIIIIITSPWSSNGSFDQEILQILWNLNVQCVVCKSATGLCPDGVHTITTLRKNSFNIITVVIPRKARHSKPSTPFLVYHIHSIPFRLSHNALIPFKKKKIIILSQKRDLFFEMSSCEAIRTVVPIHIMCK